MRSVSSAYWLRLQGESINICELIELDTPTQSFRWTTANVTLVSSLQEYEPFPGTSGAGIEESSDMGVSITDFTVINSSDVLAAIMESNNLERAELSIHRVFVDTPDLGRMTIYRGFIGDYTYTRNIITGQGRNLWGSNNIQWPYYTYMDQCTWRFGSQGCGIDPTSYGTNSLETTGGTYRVLTFATSTLVGSYANGYFDRGRLTVMNGVNSGSVRGIYVQSGDVIELFNRLAYACNSGDIIKIAPGCRKRFEQDCHSKYNNTSSFLGFPWIPKQEQAF